MKLFDGFEVVKFTQENLIFVTHNGFLYYIFNPKYQSWRKYRNAGNDHITVSNYAEVSRTELAEAMNGVFPQRATDFMRLCHPSQLCIRDMLAILKEDYENYLSEYDMYHTVHVFLLESNKCDKSFKKIKEVLDQATAYACTSQQVIDNLKKASLQMLGRDIFKKEIGIVDGHDSSSYFWIMPVRVIDDGNLITMDNVAEMRSLEISIEEDDVDQYLSPFLDKHFDEELEVNKRRAEANGFEWYLTYNFFTFSSIANILRDIKETISALSAGKENGFTKKIIAAQSKEYRTTNPQEYNITIERIVDFYRRFIYRMEYMMTVGAEKGYNLISFMGP